MIRGKWTPYQKKCWDDLFTSPPPELTWDESHTFLKKCTGASLSSDAFFPFRDGIDAAAAAGITSVIQPGGSMRDEEVIAAADEANMAMVFTGIRHFRH